MADFPTRKHYSKFGKALTTRLEANDIQDDACTDILNIDFSSDSAIGPRLGSVIFGNATAASATARRILSMFSAKKRNGTEIPVRIMDGDANAIMQWYSVDADAWQTLLSGLTAARSWGFTSYDTATDDRAYMGNGYDENKEWVVAECLVNGVNALNSATINVKVGSQQTGDATADFPASGTLVINGVAVTYTGKTASTFTGAGAHAAYTGNEAITFQPTAQVQTGLTTVKTRIWLTKDGCIWMSGNPSSPTSMYKSRVGLPEDFSESTPRDAGDGDQVDFPEGGGGVTSIREKGSAVLVFKEDSINQYELTLTASGAGTTGPEEIPSFKTIVTAPNIGCVRHESSVTPNGNEYFFVSKKGAVRKINEILNGQARSTFQVQPITDDIRPTIKDAVFDKSDSVYYDEKLLIAYRTSSDTTYNDKVLVYDLATGGLGFYSWQVGAWMVYDKKLYYGSSQSPNTFECFNGYVDEDVDSAGVVIQTPILAKWRTKKFDFDEKSLTKEILYWYIEGAITEGTDITVQVGYDEANSRGVIEKTISGTGSYVIGALPAALAAYAIAEQPLSGTITEVDGLNRFRVYLSLAIKRAFNFDLLFQTDGAGDRWKIDTHAAFPELISEPESNLKL